MQSTIKSDPLHRQRGELTLSANLVGGRGVCGGNIDPNTPASAHLEYDRFFIVHHKMTQPRHGSITHSTTSGQIELLKHLS